MARTHRLGDDDAARRRKLEQAVRTYFEACNEASREKFDAVLADDVVHYFPPQVGGPYRGKQAVADLWIGFVRNKGSQWTIDRLVCDGHEVAIEWTHFKTKAGEHIRGAEWYEFDEAGKIKEIRAYYASPRDAAAPANELEGFPYAEKGFPLQSPSTPPALEPSS
jgi:ketosteroid isomerase-like protein